ncbi:hypothetical protein BDF21DRAFT_493011 [Thamnidium elegans]|nr:hypothetical protein BDF21DRAFT_493011 [Thamnidium elegans]
MVKKRVKITCTHTLKNKKLMSIPIWRRWMIQINPVERAASASLAHYIDHVEYILHESFETPRIGCGYTTMVEIFDEPYILKQEGWGEFDLGIVFHFKSKDIPSQTIMFDLNFSKPKYFQIGILEVQEDNRKRSISSSSSSSSTITSMAGTPPDNDVFSLFGFLANQKEYVYNGRSAKQQINSCYIFNRNKQSRSTSQNISSGNNNVVPEKINISILAKRLESLNDENLRNVYNIMLQYDRRNMSIVETKDQVILDLHSLGIPLLKKLWELTTDLEAKNGLLINMS